MALDVQIVGASFDSPAENEDWANDHGLQYELWSDGDRTLALTYGAATTPDQAIALRKTVVLDADGNLCLRYDSVGPSTHPGEVLDDLTLLFGAATTP